MALLAGGGYHSRLPKSNDVVFAVDTQTGHSDGRAHIYFGADGKLLTVCANPKKFKGDWEGSNFHQDLRRYGNVGRATSMSIK